MGMFLFEKGFGATIEITGRCNFRCRYCYINSSESFNDLSTVEWMRILIHLKNIGIENVLFTGGEPLIRQDFLILLEYADDIGLISSCRSNGSLINKNLVTRLSYLKNFRSMCISLDGPTMYLNDLLRHPGSFQGVIQGARLLREEGIHTYLETTFGRDNISLFEEFLIITKALKVDGLVARALVPAGRGEYAKNKCLNPKRILDLINYFSNNGHNYDVEIKTPCILSDDNLCRRMINIKPDGSVSYCYLLRDTIAESVFEIDTEVFNKEIPCKYRINS